MDATPFNVVLKFYSFCPVVAHDSSKLGTEHRAAWNNKHRKYIVAYGNQIGDFVILKHFRMSKPGIGRPIGELHYGALQAAVLVDVNSGKSI